MHHRLEKKTPREERLLNPSFSSTLLDKIYRSIDEGDRKSTEMKFHRETTTTTTIAKKHNRSNNVKYNNRNSMVEEEHGKRKDKKVVTHQSCFLPTHGDDQDVLFFSSTSISSDTSSGGFSSSDNESIMSRASCFAPSKPKPVVKKKSNNNQKQPATACTFDGFCHKSKTEGIEVHDDNTLFKSKLRALKIYNNLKKVKQPISPGGRLTTFLNSLFANAKKSKSSRSCHYEVKEKEEDVKSERKLKSKSFSNCSSASSFSRSCLSKTSSSEREKMFNGVKRTVRFYPVSVIVDEENRPCGHKCLYEEEKLKLPVLEKSKVVEKDLVLKDMALRINKVNDHQQCKTTYAAENDEEEEDDAASYASSDLFELDHLAVLGNARYCEELPVYETTHVSTNRAIANGLII
ncbi:unnamed protein product [Lupinus luteus]|uniref:Protein BIG GRAIN 1-like B n=1 Tax=Lupinus luteus TaxID=3873 RepID=A0AAV1XJ84_LUPLU